MDDKLYQIALTLLPKVGPVTVRNLVSYCGSVPAVFEASTKELCRVPGVGARISQAIRASDVLEQAASEYAFLKAHNIQPLFYLDDDYPARLRHLPGSPTLLYYKGTASLNASRTVAIIGTRRASPQGIGFCEKLVEELAPYGVTIISGLAFGVDVCAHRACVEYGVPTIGVLGHGLRRIYPHQHRKVAYDMLENGGLLSEYTSRTGPSREHFPMRNRIVAGICDALIVIETPRKGGSMITAAMANDYNRDVFAVPGRVRDKLSEGCNWLIKSKRAALLEGVEDLVAAMRWDALDAPKAVQSQLFVELSGTEQIVVDAINEQEQVSIDQLCYLTKKPGSEVATLLLELEFKGVVRPLPGKQYMLA